MLGLGLGLQYSGVLFAYDSQAVAHYNRVIADGGTIPAGLVGCDAWFKAVKGVYGVSDITSAISSGIHPHYLGYKAGAGSGATLGSAAQTCYNAIGSTGDVIQTTAASQPLILPHTGTNYVWLSGVASNVFTSNSQSSFNFGGDFSMVFDVKPLISPNIEVSGCLNSLFYSFAIVSPGVLRFSGGGATISSTSSINTSIRQWIRISRSGNNWLFYTSTDGITWTQLGTTVVNAVSLSSASINIRVGDGGGAIGTPYSGIIYRGLFYMDSTATTIVRDFNPASYSRATSATTWTSTTGEVWTLNTPSTNNALKAAIVDTTYLMGNGTSIGMRAASLNMNQTGIASYTAIRKFVNTVGSQIITELGTSISSAAGKYFGINFTANQEEFGVYANVGLNNSRYSQTSTSLKLATQIIDIANANEASPYLINNSSQTFIAQDSANNNTAAMNATGYNLLARNNAASLWANVMLACDIVSKNADSTGTQTAMYSALKPFLVNCI